eukprot:CAMPEP_0178398478 /NCGR_PEP_ID=MMETSP0689_2-20121128/14793_1 /TAXON_ID=160604 /ORGANISM="Amphidinium massartii, Strain CS-259" /LENGTH=492 /DNA_ID=CAMNT_0020019241 /DNA_START=18 /DNA_END=1496 /DNA_ORIENTATION=+
MMRSSFLVSAVVLLWVPLCDALMHAAGQLEALRSGVVEHRLESSAADSLPRAPGMTGMWVAKNGDMHRTGSSHSIAPRDLSSGPSWRWYAPAGPNPLIDGLILSTPLVDNEQNIIESTSNGDMIKFSREGQQIWTQHGPGSSHNPVLADGAVYSVRSDGTFFSVDAQTGEILWESRVGNSTSYDSESVLVTEGVVVAAFEALISGVPGPSGGSTIVAASVADGHEVWRLQLNGSWTFNFMSAAYNGSIIFQTTFGDVYRISPIDGAVMWSQPGIGAAEGTAAQFYSTAGPALDTDGNIYSAFNIAPGEGVVKALSFADGQVLWERRFPLEANAAPAVGNLDGTRGGPLAVFVALGNNLERVQLPEQQANRTVEAKAVALNAASGESIWELALPEWRGPAAGDTPTHVCWPDQFANPSVDGNGTVYFARASGRIYALHDDNHDGELSEESGEVSWFDAGAAYQAQAAISDGMLAVAPCNGLMVFLSDSAAAQP